jgi:hypothetical protein
MTFLKTTWSALSVGVLAMLAVIAIAAAKRQKANAEKWQGKAVDAELGNVEKGVGSAKAHLTQAKLANARAGEAKTKAREKLDAIGKKDPELAAVISGWKSARIK